MTFCNKCGTEHDRHCPCHKWPNSPTTMAGPEHGVGRLKSDMPRTKLAARCQRCGNDEWLIRRSRRTCSRCGFEQPLWPQGAALIGTDVAERMLDEQLGPLITICPQCRVPLEKDGKCSRCGIQLIDVPPGEQEAAGYPAHAFWTGRERIKQKALNEPTDAPPKPSRRRDRCSRLITHGADKGGEYLCTTCLEIRLTDAPVGGPADAGIRVGFFGLDVKPLS